MSADEWKCRVIRTTDGGLVLDLPEELATALAVTSGDDIVISQSRNGMFDLWKDEPPFDPSEMIDRMNRICREALDDPSS